MTVRKIAAIYSILVGVSIIATWAAYFATGTVMGARPATAGLGFHIAAEALTAVVMIIGGSGLLSGKKWGLSVCFIGLGMLLYAVVNSPGYYLAGVNFMVWVFAGSGVCAIIFIALGFFIKEESK